MAAEHGQKVFARIRITFLCSPHVKHIFVALVQANKRHRHFSLWTTQRNIFLLKQKVRLCVLQRVQAPTKEQNSGQGHSQQPLANLTFWIAISISIFSTGSQR